MNIETIVDKRINKDFGEGEWTHKAHLVVCWYIVSEYNFYEALCILRAQIIELNYIRKGEGFNSPTS